MEISRYQIWWSWLWWWWWWKLMIRLMNSDRDEWRQPELSQCCLHRLDSGQSRHADWDGYVYPVVPYDFCHNTAGCSRYFTTHDMASSQSELTPHYGDGIMSAMVSQITGVSTVCSTVCSVAGQRKSQSSASLAFMRGIHRWPVDSPHKGPVTRKMLPFEDVIMLCCG